MQPDEKSSVFAYVLGTVLLLALGVGWFVLHRESPAPSSAMGAAATALPPSITPIARVATLEQAEQYFAVWGGYVIWENEVGEFALWSSADNDYTQFFEVRRGGGEFTFRRLTKLTRPLIDHGEAAHAPMAFTETQAMRDAYYRANPHASPSKRAWSASQNPTPNLPPRSPERFAPPRQPAGQANPADLAASERALIAALQAALERAHEQSIDRHVPDLLAVLQLNRVTPPAPQASVAEIDAAIARRKDVIEGILAASMAFLSQSQLSIYRTELHRELQALETRRAQLLRRG